MQGLNSSGAVAAEGVDGSGSSDDFARVLKASGDENFLAGFQGDTVSIYYQRVAALHNHHVFVVVVGVSGGISCLTAGPKGHLTAVRAIEDVAFDARRGLAGASNSVRGILMNWGNSFIALTLKNNLRE